ncbi:MAG: hypothetical protein WC812_04645 [Candidatus Pacearchaeota archaeon]|jgi:hypothetical protein
MKKNSSKKIFFSIFLLFGIIVFSYSVLAASGCCEKTKDGFWCQMVDDISSKCDSSNGLTSSPTSCDQTAYCSLGTCINSVTGECVPNLPKSECESDSAGEWDSRTLQEIPTCQLGCCSYGPYTQFVTQTKCKQLGTDYGVDPIFNDEITDELECYNSDTSYKEGACIFENGDCRRTSKTECDSQSGNFEEGFLCTATNLETQCARSSETICDENGRVYFKDSCGNLANIYNEEMFSTNPNAWNSEMKDYWTYIKEIDDSSICSFTGTTSSTCGNCDFLSGSVCSKYRLNDPTMPNSKPEFGNYVCASMDCAYDTDRNGEREIYHHGESWCAMTEGTYWDQNAYEEFGLGGIRINKTTGDYVEAKILKELENQSNYNLPGSQYVLLKCIDGEVLQESCMSYRNSFCVDVVSHESEFREAHCIGNDWRACLSKTTKKTCEGDSIYGTQMCKWVGGFRLDGKSTTTKESNRQNIDQGSCVPLLSPGLEFWTDKNNAECSLGNIQGSVTYATSWTVKRDHFAEFGTKSASETCMNDCYLIPGYASDLAGSDLQDQKAMENIYTGGDVPSGDLKDYMVSLRKAYYCEGKTGKASGPSVSCSGEPDKRNNFPVYWTHQEFYDSITERARSLGDCGYKAGAYISLSEMNESNVELELMTVVFQKISQEGDVKDEDKGNLAEKIYINNEYVGDQCGYRSGEYDEELCQLENIPLEESTDGEE